MKALVLVFLGGGFGSLCRFLVYRLINQDQLSFPYATFTVNIAGSLILGIFLGCIVKSDNLSNNWVLFMTTGFCGGFTTFSTFAFENQELIRAGEYSTFLLYSFGSLSLGILAVITGIFLSRFFA